MRPPFPYIYYSIIAENQRLISHYERGIEYFRILVIDNKLDSEVELIRNNKERIKNNFDINDPKKYRQREDTAKYHPLALEYYEVQQQLEPYFRKQPCNLTIGIQSLCTKGELLHNLSTAKVPGFHDKIEKLVSKDLRQQDKVFYEMMVAGQYLAQGHMVKFIETSIKKSPDILIDENVEIECKSKDAIHPYYRKYQDVFDTVTRIVPEWMHNERVNYLIYIVFYKEISVSSIKLIKDKLHEIICEKKEGIFKIDYDKISIKAKILLPYDLKTDKPMTAENYPEIMNAIPNISETDFMQSLSNLYLTNEGKIIKWNYRYLAMKIPKHPTRSIISNAKTAANQVNRLLPGVIYIDISYLNQKMKIDDLNKLGEQLDSFLRHNPAVNAVVITDTYKTGREGAVEIKNGLWVVRNTLPTHKLPETFRIPFEEVSSKESLISDNYWV